MRVRCICAEHFSVIRPYAIHGDKAQIQACKRCRCMDWHDKHERCSKMCHKCDKFRAEPNGCLTSEEWKDAMALLERECSQGQAR